MTNKYKIFFNNRILWVGGYNPITDKQLYQAAQKYTNQQELQQFITHFRENEAIESAIIYNEQADELMENVIKCFKYIEAAGGVVTNINKEVLVIHRLGVWDLPKGKIETGESPEIAAIREVEEECGISQLTINQNITDTYHTYELKGKQVLKKTYWYAIDCKSNEKPTPQQEEDITMACWTSDLTEVLRHTYPSISDVLHTAGYR